MDLPELRPKKVLFDHLPKCGGSSLRAYLEANYPKRKIFSLYPTIKSFAEDGTNLLVEGFKNLPQHYRHSFDLITGHHAHSLLDYVHPECLKVTIFREPVDRIASHYYYAKRKPEHHLYSIINSSKMSLDEYATSGISPELCNWYTAHFSGLTVNDIKQNPEKSVLRAANNVLSQYDIIGFLDNFSKFIVTLRKQAGLKNEYHDKKINVTKDRPNINNIEQSTLNKIAQVNHLDIALYKMIREATG